LTLEEFERRYDAMPRLWKAELIEGTVHMPPPATFDDHGGPHFDFITWLGMYRSATPGVRGGDNATLRLELATMAHPDAFLIVLPSHGGRVRISEDGNVIGAPELVGEVSASSASYDLHTRLELYRRNSVQEYVVWRVFDHAIDWFALRAGNYELLRLNPLGIYQSEVFPRLWLDPVALINGDMLRVTQVLQQGLATPDHANFVAQLQQQASRQHS
jgi:hypothetical protein